MRLHKSHLFALLVVGAGALLPSSASAGPPPGPPPPPSTWTPVATHLDSPRGVAWFQGHLVVAEAGHGGPNCSFAPGPPPPTHPEFCFGRSSQISRVNMTTKVATPFTEKLFSITEFHGGPPEALGVDGISVQGGHLLGILGVFPQMFDNYHCAPGNSGCAADLAAAKAQAGHLISVGGNGKWKSVASVGAYDYDWTGKPSNVPPDQEHDANPYGVLAVPGGALVADSGSNTLDFVSSRGRTTVLDYFHYPHPPFPTDAVPTCVVKTDDALWVADLDGQLFREQGGSHTAVPNAFTKHVTGCTAGNNNDIYFVNIFTTDFPSPFSGNVVRYKVDEGTWSIVGTPLDFPNMITFGPDHNLYVSADSVCPPGGLSGPMGNPCPQGGTVMRMAAPSDDNNQGGDDGGGDHSGSNHGGNHGPSEQ